MSYRIPFNRATPRGKEQAYIAEALTLGHISGDGTFTRRSEVMLQELLGSARVLLTTSCTDALELSALLLGVGPGDEVVVPSFTFVSTANAFALRGCSPVFCDIRPDTLNLDEEQVDRLVNERTRAVVPVHYAGVACEMHALADICTRRSIAIVEDNAHGLFGSYRGRKLGTFGALATLSFHETKNITCGEGGALIVNDPELVERAEILREKGTDRSRFFRGQVDKYTWRDLGSSYLPSDLLAAFLWAQLEEWTEIQAERRAVWERYRDGLAEWGRSHDVRLPMVPDDREQAHHMFYLVLPAARAQERLIAHLRQRGILGVFHYLPLHLSEMGRRFGGRPGDCPVAEDLSTRVVRLPFFNSLSLDDQVRVIEAVREFRP